MASVKASIEASIGTCQGVHGVSVVLPSAVTGQGASRPDPSLLLVPSEVEGILGTSPLLSNFSNVCQSISYALQCSTGSLSIRVWCHLCYALS